MSDFLAELEECIPALRRYAFTLYYQREEADDLVQDCLERALQKRRLWQPGSSMRAWLFTMQHNIYVNNIRQRGRQPCLTSNVEALVSMAEPVKSSSLLNDLDYCLQQLPEDQRQVLILVTIEGFSYKQVGQILDKPLGTVMSRLSRARKNLQALMNGEVISPRPHLRNAK